jgi:APA family basic amino acid/polyamine antiporter
MTVLTVLIGGLALVNIRGVAVGAQVSNLLTVAKVLPLLILVAGGLIVLSVHGSPVLQTHPSHSIGAWIEAVLLLVYPFGGFESALIPTGEVRNPSRDIPVALLVALPTITAIYFLIQVVVVRTLANPAQHSQPLSAAALVLGGRALAATVTLGALVSAFGTLAANMIANPRITFALAEQGDFPPWFAAVHRRYQTPYVSIAIFSVLLWVLALLGTFRGNATLSAVSRLCAYGVTCAALPILRKKLPMQEGFRLPGGVVFAALGICFVLALLSRMGRAELMALAITAALAVFNWLALRPGRSRGPESIAT